MNHNYALMLLALVPLAILSVTAIWYTVRKLMPRVHMMDLETAGIGIKKHTLPASTTKTSAPTGGKWYKNWPGEEKSPNRMYSMSGDGNGNVWGAVDNLETGESIFVTRSSSVSDTVYQDEPIRDFGGGGESSGGGSSDGWSSDSSDSTSNSSNE